MSAGKNVLRRAVAAAIESSYNVAQTITLPGDAFHVHDEFEITPSYQFDGSRQGTAAGASMQQREAPQGRYFTVDLPHRIRAPGAAYSSSNKPTVDRWLRAHGMTATLVTTSGSEKITYAPFTDGTWESLTADFYTGKEKVTGTGIYVTKFVHKAEGLGTPEIVFSLKGALGLPSDSNLPTITAYPNASIPHVKAAAATCSITGAGGGTFGGLVRSSTVTSERAADDRMSQISAGGGYAGLQLGRFTQTIEMSVEGTLFAGGPSYTSATAIDPYRMMDEATLATVVVGFNQSVQYKRYKFLTSASAQITDVQKDKAGAIRLWHLTIQCNPTSEVADDGLSVVFD